MSQYRFPERYQIIFLKKIDGKFSATDSTGLDDYLKRVRFASSCDLDLQISKKGDFSKEDVERAVDEGRVVAFPLFHDGMSGDVYCLNDSEVKNELERLRGWVLEIAMRSQQEGLSLLNYGPFGELDRDYLLVGLAYAVERGALIEVIHQDRRKAPLYLPTEIAEHAGIVKPDSKPPHVFDYFRLLGVQ